MAIIENSIKIVKGGVIQGNEKSTGAALPVVDTYISYGGAADKWGLAWTPADINAANFGVVYSAKSTIGLTSHYLKATNFGFAIPGGATIDGILVEIEQKYETGALGCAYPEVDHIRITVYYTEVVGTNMKVNIADVFKDIDAIKINIGDEWKDVAGIKINIGDVWKDVF